MKYILSVFVLAFSFNMLVTAQEETNTKKKNVEDYLPKAGDISIGADALPYLEYVGNMFNNTTNNTLNLGNNTLYFKYFLKDDRAIRAIIKINNTTTTSKKYVADNYAQLDPLSTAQVEDKWVLDNNDIGLTLGYQIYKKRNRLSGYYGAQIGYMYSRTIQEYTYGNPITALNQTPTSSNFNANINGNKRTLKTNSGVSNTMSVSGFIGVEYFILPCISVGGEYSLGYSYTFVGQSNSTYEAWNGTKVVEMDQPATPQQQVRSLKTSRPATYGGLYLSFYF